MFLIIDIFDIKIFFIKKEEEEYIGIGGRVCLKFSSYLFFSILVYQFDYFDLYIEFLFILWILVFMYFVEDLDGLMGRFICMQGFEIILKLCSLLVIFYLDLKKFFF